MQNYHLHSAITKAYSVITPCPRHRSSAYWDCQISAVTRLARCCQILAPAGPWLAGSSSAQIHHCFRPACLPFQIHPNNKYSPLLEERLPYSLYESIDGTFIFLTKATEPTGSYITGSMTQDRCEIVPMVTSSTGRALLLPLGQYSFSILMRLRSWYISQNLKRSRDREHDHAPLRDYLPIQRLILHMANQCTKFEVSSLSHSRDTWGEA